MLQLPFSLSCDHLIFESSLEDLLPNVFNAFNEYGLHLSLLNRLVRLLPLLKPQFLLKTIDLCFLFSNGVCVVSLENLYIALDLILNVLLTQR